MSAARIFGGEFLAAAFPAMQWKVLRSGKC